ncbi:hypothetical protein [Streptomyces zingiberis]|uniref:Uncharacterized protein n=1 Tax=Streptomyces zingiberis TaxID=2053010 RepID=A0ABX1BY56_9ACTN|nr:hypothetical protein [Streptomyces zingiberis]NJQ00432.1 hypothetical protein [Streptomyces zingiberis]
MMRRTLGKIADRSGPLGPLIHTDPEDRPAENFGGTVTVHFGPDVDSYLLLPAIPAA